MSADPVRQSADARPPVASSAAANAGGTDGVFVKNLTLASQLFVIPAKWKGRYVTFCADSQRLGIVFGGASVAASLSQESTVDGSGNITFAPTSCLNIPADQSVERRIPNDAAITHFAVIGAAASGQIRAYNSTGEGGSAA